MAAMNSSADAVVTPETTSYGQDLGADTAAVVRSLATRLHAAERISDIDVFVDAVMAREALGSTVLPGGIAMPHARSHAVVAPTVAVALLPEAVELSPGADPVRLVLLIAAPGQDSAGYLALLQKVATACVKNAFIDDVLASRDAGSLAEVVGSALSPR